MSEPTARVSRAYRVLDVALTVAGRPGEVAAIDLAYRRFRSAAPPAAEAHPLELELVDETALRVGARRVPLVPGLDRGLQLYQQLQTALMDAIEHHAVLHAAALVGRDGEALLLAAPSGHGKSSLALELARRGLGFLGDDVAPLELARRRIWPFPRAVGVVPRSDGPLGEPFRAHALDPAAPRLLGKSLLDVGDVLGEAALAVEPAPLRRVLVLASGSADAPPATTRVDLAARAEDGEELDGLFRATPGAEVLERRDLGPLRAWRLRLHHDRRPTERLARVFESDQIVLFEKHWDVPPDFTGRPELRPLPRRVAAEVLAREMLNRRRSGRLLARYGGSVTRLFLDLAGTLSQADCFSLRVGDCAGTADLVERLVAGAL
jgi:hypothetical protein